MFLTNEWYSFPILGRADDARFVPYWWTTLAKYYRILKSHAERGTMDNQKMALPLDTRIFTDAAWVQDWYDERSGAKERREMEEENATAMAW